MAMFRKGMLLVAVLVLTGMLSGCQQGFLTGKWEGSVFTNGKAGFTNEVREFFPNGTFVWITQTSFAGFTGTLKVTGTYKVSRNLEAPGHVDILVKSINDHTLSNPYHQYGIFKMSGFLGTRQLHLIPGTSNINRPAPERLEATKGPVFIGKRKTGGLLADMF